ncbi:MAG: hypothetical protein AB7Q42_22735 [Acidimicrobiia bacterium]
MTRRAPRERGNPSHRDRFDVREDIDWRAKHPFDDMLAELLQAEFKDDTGTV